MIALLTLKGGNGQTASEGAARPKCGSWGRAASPRGARRRRGAPIVPAEPARSEHCDPHAGALSPGWSPLLFRRLPGSG